MILRYLSLCSGIEAATVAWDPLGWTPAAFAEIEKFPSAVLDHHYPSVPNLGDITKLSGKDFRGEIDLIVGGPPCQSYSVAGLRGGLDDPRGQLTLDFLRIVGEARPRWFALENVVGLLSIDSGRPFGTILRQMAKLGYGFAYRVLNSVHWGIPQSRRRVYLIGYFGDWRPAAAVLFERYCLSGHTPARRGPKTKFAGNAAAGPGSHRRPAGIDGEVEKLTATFEPAPSMCAGPPFSRTGNSRVECEALVTQALTGRLGGGGSRRLDFESEAFIAHTLRGEGFDASEDGTGRANLIPINLQVATRHKALGKRTALGIGRDGDPAFTLTQTHSHGVFINAQGLSIRGREGGATAELSGEAAPALRAPQGGGDKAHVLHDLAVRRLTVLECERLQGLPNFHTLIPWRGKPASACPDGPRYKAIGNSMPVPVMRWLGERIIWVEKIMAESAASTGTKAGHFSMPPLGHFQVPIDAHAALKRFRPKPALNIQVYSEAMILRKI